MNPPRQWHRILSIDALDDEIQVQVGYYSKDHLAKIQRSLPIRQAELPADGEVIRVPKVEFLACWLFEDRDPDDPLSASFDALAASAADALPDLKRHFEHCDGDLRALSKKPGTERPGDISTRLGVAVGLAVANRVLGVNRADWQKLPKTTKDGKEEKRMDYALAGTIDGYVALENKGSVVYDNRRKTSTVSQHCKSIADKKSEVRKKQPNQPLLGAIAVADSREDSTLKCWLLDPPQKLPTDLDPVVFRIIARLTYYGGLLRCVFPRWKGLFAELKSRIRLLSKADDWSRLNGLDLRYPSKTPIHANWNAGRKVHARSPTNGLWAGVIKPCGPDYLLFIGVSQKWVELILNQNLHELLKVTTESISEKLTLQWEATDRSLRHLDLRLAKTMARVDYREGDSTHSVQLPTVVHQTSSGFAFALVPLSSKHV